MPLKLIPPRTGRSPHYGVRGSHLGVHVNRSLKTGDRKLAKRLIKTTEREIEDFAVTGSITTFAAAAVAYMQAGGERTYLAPLIKRFGNLPLEAIDQVALDLAAADLYPRASPGTRNRQVYTPVSAILNHARPDRLIRFHRPKEGQGRTRWLEPDQFELLLANLPRKLKPLAIFLVYSGCRLSEALSLNWETVNLQQRVAIVPKTKNGTPRAAHLTDRALAALAEIEPKEGRVFGYRHRWSIGHAWRAGATRAGLPWATPHVLRHTWATWMRRYAGADDIALLATGAWKDAKSVRRYSHTMPTEEARRADKLPGNRS